MGRRTPCTVFDLPPEALCEQCGRRNDDHNVRHRFVSGQPRMDPWAAVARLRAQRDALVEAVVQVEAAGHNDDCIFCGFKDLVAQDAIAEARGEEEK